MASQLQLNVAVNPIFNTATAYSSGAKLGNQFASGYNASFRKHQALGRITGDASEFQKSMEAANARVIAFGASAGSIYLIKSAMQKLVSETIMVEKSLADINVVLSLGSSELKNFSGEMFKAAAASGQTFETASKVALEFARHGVSATETTRRMSSAMQLMRISGLSAQEAVSSITAAINAFNKEGITSEDIVGRLTAVDTKFAVSAQDLAKAIERVGATAQDAGVQFNQLLGLVTAAQTITARGGAVIGNAFKSIFTRLARPETLNDLASVGIATKNASGQVLPMIDILKNLSAQYGTLSFAQKSFVTEAVGGVYQVNVLKASLVDLGNGFSVYDRAVFAAEHSTGLIEKRMASLNETMSSKLNTSALVLTKSFSSLGMLMFKSSSGTSGFDKLNEHLTSFSRLLDEVDGKGSSAFKGFQTLTQGAAKGIGDLISGPGLQMAAMLITRVFKNIGSFAVKSGKDFLGLGQEATTLKTLESSLARFFSRNEEITKRMHLGQLKRNDAHAIFLKQLDLEILKQTIAHGNVKVVARNTRPFIGTSSPNTFADGFIPPSVERAEKSSAYSAGYTPGAVKAGDLGGQPIVYNTAERIISPSTLRQYGLDSKGLPAIVPPTQTYADAFIAKTGIDPRKIMANGFIPNFAIPKFIGAINANKISHNYSGFDIFSLFETDRGHMILPTSAKTGEHDTQGKADKGGVSGKEEIGARKLSELITDKSKREEIAKAFKSKLGIYPSLGPDSIYGASMIHHPPAGGQSEAYRRSNFSPFDRTAKEVFTEIKKGKSGRLSHVFQSMKNVPQYEKNEAGLYVPKDFENDISTGKRRSYVDEQRERKGYEDHLIGLMKLPGFWEAADAGPEGFPQFFRNLHASKKAKGFIPNFAAKELGYGCNASVYKLKGGRVSKVFDAFEASHGGGGEGAMRYEIENIEAVEEVMSTNRGDINPLWTFPKMLGKKRRAIIKEEFIGKTTGQLQRNNTTGNTGIHKLVSPFIDQISKVFDSRGIIPYDFNENTGNTMVNPELGNILLKISQRPSQVGANFIRRLGRPDVLKNVGAALHRKGGRLAAVDVGNFDIDSGYSVPLHVRARRLAEALGMRRGGTPSLSGGFIPNFTKEMLTGAGDGSLLSTEGKKLKVDYLSSSAKNPLFMILSLLKEGKIKNIDAGSIIGPKVPSLLLHLKEMLPRLREKYPKIPKRVGITGNFSSKDLFDKAYDQRKGMVNELEISGRLTTLLDRIARKNNAKVKIKDGNIEFIDNASEKISNKIIGIPGDPDSGRRGFIGNYEVEKRFPRSIKSNKLSRKKDAFSTSLADFKSLRKAVGILNPEYPKNDDVDLAKVFPKGIAHGFIPNFNTDNPQVIDNGSYLGVKGSKSFMLYRDVENGPIHIEDTRSEERGHAFLFWNKIVEKAREEGKTIESKHLTRQETENVRGSKKKQAISFDQNMSNWENFRKIFPQLRYREQSHLSTSGSMTIDSLADQHHFSSLRDLRNTIDNMDPDTVENHFQDFSVTDLKTRILRSKGFIPNFSPIQDAVNREISSGYSLGQIRVGKHASLKSHLNPEGSGVYNSTEGSLSNAMSMARTSGIRDLRIKGAAKGFIPNFSGTAGEISIGLGVLQGIFENLSTSMRPLSFGFKETSERMHQLNTEYINAFRLLRNRQQVEFAGKTYDGSIRGNVKQFVLDYEARFASKGFSRKTVSAQEAAYSTYNDAVLKRQSKLQSVGYTGQMVGPMATQAAASIANNYVNLNLGKSLEEFSAGLTTSFQFLAMFPNKLGAVLSVANGINAVGNAVSTYTSKLASYQKSYDVISTRLEKVRTAGDMVAESYDRINSVLSSSLSSFSDFNAQQKKLAKALLDLSNTTGGEKLYKELTSAGTMEARKTAISKEVISMENERNRGSLKVQYSQLSKENSLFGYNWNKNKPSGLLSYVGENQKISNTALMKESVNSIQTEMLESITDKDLIKRMISGNLKGEDVDTLTSEAKKTESAKWIGEYAGENTLNQVMKYLAHSLGNLKKPDQFSDSQWKEFQQKKSSLDMKELALRQRYNQMLQNTISKGAIMSDYILKRKTHEGETAYRESAFGTFKREKADELAELTTADVGMIKTRTSTKREEIQKRTGHEASQQSLKAAESIMDIISKSVTEHFLSEKTREESKTGEPGVLSEASRKKAEFLSSRQEYFSKFPSELIKIAQNPNNFGEKFLGKDASKELNQFNFSTLSNQINALAGNPAFYGNIQNILFDTKTIHEKGYDELRRLSVEQIQAIKAANFKELASALNSSDLLKRGSVRQLRRRVRRDEYILGHSRNAISRGEAARDLISIIPSSRRDYNDRYIRSLYNRTESGYRAADRRVLGGTGIGRFFNVNETAFAQTFGNLRGMNTPKLGIEEGGAFGGGQNDAAKINTEEFQKAIQGSSDNITDFGMRLSETGNQLDSLKASLNSLRVEIEALKASIPINKEAEAKAPEIGEGGKWQKITADYGAMAVGGVVAAFQAIMSYKTLKAMSSIRVPAAGYIPNLGSFDAIAHKEKTLAAQNNYLAGPVFKDYVSDGMGHQSEVYRNGFESKTTVRNANGYLASTITPPNGFGKDPMFAAAGMYPPKPDTFKFKYGSKTYAISSVFNEQLVKDVLAEAEKGYYGHKQTGYTGERGVQHVLKKLAEDYKVTSKTPNFVPDMKSIGSKIIKLDRANELIEHKESLSKQLTSIPKTHREALRDIVKLSTEDLTKQNLSALNSELKNQKILTKGQSLQGILRKLSRQNTSITLDQANKLYERLLPNAFSGAKIQSQAGKMLLPQGESGLQAFQSIKGMNATESMAEAEAMMARTTTATKTRIRIPTPPSSVVPGPIAPAQASPAASRSTALGSRGGQASVTPLLDAHNARIEQLEGGKIRRALGTVGKVLSNPWIRGPLTALGVAGLAAQAHEGYSESQEGFGNKSEGIMNQIMTGSTKSAFSGAKGTSNKSVYKGASRGIAVGALSGLWFNPLTAGITAPIGAGLEAAKADKELRGLKQGGYNITNRMGASGGVRVSNEQGGYHETFNEGSASKFSLGGNDDKYYRSMNRGMSSEAGKADREYYKSLSSIRKHGGASPYELEFMEKYEKDPTHKNDVRRVSESVKSELFAGKKKTLTEGLSQMSGVTSKGGVDYGWLRSAKNSSVTWKKLKTQEERDAFEKTREWHEEYQSPRDKNKFLKRAENTANKMATQQIYGDPSQSANYMRGQPEKQQQSPMDKQAQTNAPGTPTPPPINSEKTVIEFQKSIDSLNAAILSLSKGIQVNGTLNAVLGIKPEEIIALIRSEMQDKPLPSTVNKAPVTSKIPSSWD